MTINCPSDQSEARAQLLALMRENGHLTRHLFRRRVAAIGLTMAEARALMYLELRPRISQARLAEFLGTQPIALSRVVDRLEARGWILREPSDTDRRVRLLSLSDAGVRIVAEAHAVSHAIDINFGRELPTEALTLFSKALADFNAALRGLTSK